MCKNYKFNGYKIYIHIRFYVECIILCSVLFSKFIDCIQVNSNFKTCTNNTIVLYIIIYLYSITYFEINI